MQQKFLFFQKVIVLKKFKENNEKLEIQFITRESEQLNKEIEKYHMKNFPFQLISKRKIKKS